MVPSFLIWGAGQFYEDRTSIGAVRIVAWLVSGVLTILTDGLFGIVGVLLWARTSWTRTPNWSTCTTPIERQRPLRRRAPRRRTPR